ncbi:MAG: Lar family restriction alleviation protein [Synergistaceae bacterium]|nr:Lar family restriction alleviation protein [Synergistaceae bacterium]
MSECIELKSCPNCGLQPETDRIELQTDNRLINGVVIKCRCCRIETGLRETLEGAAAEWNDGITRKWQAPDPALDTDMKPCPFCGSKGMVIGRMSNAVMMSYYAACSYCGCELHKEFLSQQMAISEWNRRA